MRSRQLALKALRFHDLTPYRIREVLLVASPYDAFILEEDGQLTEQVFFEYREVNASGPPRFTHVSTARAAFEALAEKRFDLILVMTSFSGMGVNAFGRRVKELRPGRPVVFLALDGKELEAAHDAIDPTAIDGTFLWSGDAHILFAIIKHVEDLSNVDHDTENGDVRVIIMIEDSPRYYSAFVGLLYKELLSQSRSLSSEGVNELHRLMYMRSRPKILHATSYEQGMKLLRKYRDYVMAVISDVAILREGKVDDVAGIDFVRAARRGDAELPVLLQSSDAANADIAEEINAAFADKNSPTLLAEIRSFLTNELGFGDFVFRLPDGEAVGRAKDLREMEEVLKAIPAESLAHHATHNHFSIWLMARSEFELAQRLRPRKASDFASVEEMRSHLVGVLREARRSSHRGHIADLSPARFEHDLISRTGQGALGGKARGIAFINRYLSEIDGEQQESLPIKIPQTVVVTTDMFDEFLDHNELREFAVDSDDDTEIARRFLAAPLPGRLSEDLDFLIEHLAGPLAVRSSSLLEDSLHQPFAGIYSTLMIPNSGDREERLTELSNAVRMVYASTFGSNARSYLNATGHLEEEEKMAVIIQRVIGRRHGRRYYPTFSGVAQSFNYYPVGPQKGEDGIVHVALGLGRMVVDGGLALRFSPKHPGVLPQFATPKSMLNGSQRTFYALDMEHSSAEVDLDPFANIAEYDLADAESDGTLATVGSVLSHDDGQLREDLRLSGPRVVSFNNILKHRAIPLAEALQSVIEIAGQALGGPVEIEFACEMGDWGQLTPRGAPRVGPELYILQMRPLGSRNLGPKISRLEYAPEDVLCASASTLGHGIERNIRDVIYVRRDRWKAASNKLIAREIERLNSSLVKSRRRYLLIGPGRWGTADEWLGIPVQWRQISRARVIVEASPAGYEVEPSQGTHFFQNITSLRIGYLTLPPGAEKNDHNNSAGDEFVDWKWLDEQPAHATTDHLRHVRLKKSLTVVLDGREGRGLIAKPGARYG